MDKKFTYFICSIFFVIIGLNDVDAVQIVENYGNQQTLREAGNAPKIIQEVRRPVLTINPREIDLGAIKPGEKTSGEFVLKNISTGTMEWSTYCPDDWIGMTGKSLRGKVSSETVQLLLEVAVDENDLTFSEHKPSIPTYRVKIRLEADGKELVCQRDLKAGMYRTAIRLTSSGGERTIFASFRIHAMQEIPSISLQPQRLDFGAQLPGKNISKRIELTNKGREMLTWSVALPKRGLAEYSNEFHKERYFSLQNEEQSEQGKYVVPEHLKDAVELNGTWTSRNGYPVSRGNSGTVKFRFHGGGFSIFLQSHAEDSNYSIYLNEVLLNLPDILSGQWEKKELLIAEGLADGPHTVSILIREGNLELEGFRVSGREIKQGPPGWITIFPNSGTTMSEKDYVNVKLDTSNFSPGSYRDQIVFKTNAGEEIAEVFIDVLAEAGHKLVDIFLYSKDSDYLFTADPQTESKRLIQNGYVKEGIAFRLFVAQTPGTTSFYRWYNPAKKDHFYHSSRNGGGKNLDGYVFEGIIGNIATSRMTNTRELYRWFNWSTGRHYYTTNQKAPTGLGRGYRFDGIAGYVR